jgi:alkaline phosphatase
MTRSLQLSAAVVLLTFTHLQARTLVFKGTPVSRVSLTAEQANREDLTSGQQHEFALLITKKDGKYIWESRESKEMIKIDAGTFTHFISPATGWVKIGHTSQFLEVLKMAKASGIGEEGVKMLIGQNHLSDWMLEHKYFYFEVITQGMFVGIYYGFADELDL